MKKSTVTAALYVALVFVSGVAVGGFSHWLYASSSVSATVRRPSPEEYRRKYVAELETRLKRLLNSADERSEIRTLLSPWQLAEYEQYRMERDEKSKAKPERQF